MAEVLYGLNDSEDVARWSKQLNRESIPATFAMRFASTASTSPVQIVEDLNAGAGSQVKLHLRVKGSGAGVLGDNELEGKEEGMTTYQEILYIDQLRHAFKSGGRMSEQRVNWKVRNEIKDLAVDWWSDRDDTAFFNQVCGYSAETDKRYTGCNTATAPTTVFRASARSTDASLVDGDDFTVSLIDKAVNKAKIMSPQLRPIRWRGNDYYICVLHPNQVRQLRDSGSQWYSTMQNALTGGEITSNPLFTGAIGAWNGVVFFENNRVTKGVNASTSAAIDEVRRAPLMGAQAVTLAFGQQYGPGRFDWVEEAMDYKNKLGVAIGRIFGMVKNVYNSVDYGVITLHSYSDDPS